MSATDGRFPWQSLRAIIGGRSAIDFPRLDNHTLESAEQFLQAYGFDWAHAEHRAEIEELRAQAIEFIETELLDPGEAIDPIVRAEDDVRTVICWASASEPSKRRAWACSLLRVAHTLAHCQSYFNERFGPQIRAQIFARFEPHLSMERRGLHLGHGEHAIALADFEVKPAKPTFSVAMKLLHKVENVAEDVFDRVGVRFVTKQRFDALLVVKYLREHNVFMFANVKPSRSRNTLIDLQWLEDLMAGIDEETLRGDISAEQRLDLLREAAASHPYPAPSGPAINPYSAPDYHSVQFTCRQMIRAESSSGRPIRFFFPFEIQILDSQSYEATRSGYASHDLYKQRQRDAVRKRVLGPILWDT